MRKCVFCNRRYKKGSELSFHRFPSDITELNKWLQNMKALDWTPKQRDYLCSEHFDAKCLVKHSNRTALQLGSIPTIFEGLFEDQNSVKELKIEISDSEHVFEEKEIVEEPQLAEYDQNCDRELKIEIDDSVHVFEEKEIVEEPQLAVTAYPYRDEQNCDRELKIEIADSEHVFEENEIVEEPQLGVIAYPYKYDADTTGELKKDLQDITRNDHNCGASESPNKSRINYGIAHDHQYQNTPRSSEKATQRIKQSLKISNARVKALNERVKRLKTKVASLEIVINDLNNRNKVSEERIQSLKQCDDFQMDLFNRMRKNTGDKSLSHDKYPPQLRDFAITLHNYSPKAYAYVRKKINLALPHPRVIRSWRSTVHTDPGFSQETFDSLLNESQNKMVQS